MGCGANGQTDSGSSNDKSYDPNGTVDEKNVDFQGVILKVKESSITVATDDIDPEASYPAYEVSVNNQTKIKGSVNEFSRLKVDQKIEIWVKGKWNNKSSNTMIATKINVIKE